MDPFAEPVPVARVDYQFGVHALRQQGLIEFLALAERCAAVFGSMQDERGGDGSCDVADR